MQNDEKEKCEGDANDEEFTGDEDLITDDLYDEENDTFVTPLGVMHQKSAEAYYLNGGKSSPPDGFIKP